MAKRKPLFQSSGILEEVGGSDQLDPSTLGSGVVTARSFLKGDGSWIDNPFSHGPTTMATVTDRGNGLVDISSISANFNTSADFSGSVVSLNVPVLNGLQLIANTHTYVVASYNSGNPVFQTTIDNTIINHSTIFNVVQLFWENINSINELHVFNTGAYGLGLANKISHRLIHTDRFGYQDGLILSEYGTRNVQVTSGSIWYDGEEIQTLSAASATAGQELHFYYPVAGVWNASKITTYDNQSYSNGTDLVTLGNGRYAVNWIYKCVNASDRCIYNVVGSGNYSLSQAIASQPPLVPQVILKQAILVGRIIIQKGSNTATQIDSAFSTAFSASASFLTAVSVNPTNLSGNGTAANPLNTVQDISSTSTPTFADVSLPSLSGGSVITDTLVKTTLQNIDNAFLLQKDPTGFTEPENVIVNYDSTARTVTLTGTVVAYWRGKLVSALVSGWVSPAHSASNGVYYLGYDGTTLGWSTTPWTFDRLQIAYVSYGSVDKICIRDCHGLMPWLAHRELHDVVGTYKKSGGDLAGYALNSTTAANRRPTVSACTIFDEDIQTVNSALTSSLYTKYYLTGAGATSTFVVETADIVPLLAARPYYNQFTAGAWQQTLMTNNNYQAVWLIAVPTSSSVNDQKYRYLWMQGQSQSATLATIQALQPGGLNLGGLTSVSSEFVFIAKIIIQYTAGDWQLISVSSLSGSRFSQTSSPSGNYLTSVSVGSGLSGDGTVGNPLTLTSNSFTLGVTPIALGSTISTVTGLTALGVATINGVSSSLVLQSETNLTFAGTATLTLSAVNTGAGTGNTSIYGNLDRGTGSLNLFGTGNASGIGFLYLGGAQGSTSSRFDKYGFFAGGQFGQGYITVSVDTTLYTYTTENVIFVITGATNKTITLPDAAGSTWDTGVGRVLLIKKIDPEAGSVIVSRSGNDLIQGLTSLTVSGQWNFIRLMATHNNGWVLL